MAKNPPNSKKRGPPQNKAEISSKKSKTITESDSSTKEKNSKPIHNYSKPIQSLLTPHMRPKASSSASQPHIPQESSSSAHQLQVSLYTPTKLNQSIASSNSSITVRRGYIQHTSTPIKQDENADWKSRIVSLEKKVAILEQKLVQLAENKSEKNNIEIISDDEGETKNKLKFKVPFGTLEDIKEADIILKDDKEQRKAYVSMKKKF